MTEPRGVDDVRVGEPLPLAIVQVSAHPVPLPDAAVRHEEVQLVYERLDDLQDEGLDPGPVGGEPVDVTAGVQVVAHRPEEEAEVIPLDVGPVRVEVRLLGPVAEISRHADQVRAAHIVHVLAGVGLELKPQGRPGLLERADSGERGGRVRHVPHPGDVPDPGRQAGEDLALATPRRPDLGHAYERRLLPLEAVGRGANTPKGGLPDRPLPPLVIERERIAFDTDADDRGTDGQVT